VVLMWLYDLDASILYPVIAILIAGAGEAGSRIGFRHRDTQVDKSYISTLTAAALGLLALLLAFSFSLALSRYDLRRTMVLEEANAIGSTANFALMLPTEAQPPILRLLRDYTTARIGLGIPHDPEKLARDVARSTDLQSQLWQRAVALSNAARQSLPLHRFVGSLNEMNNVHERRLTGLRNQVPPEVMGILIGVSMMAMAFTGFQGGVSDARRRAINLFMAAIIAILIMLVVDLDRPSRGLTVVPVQPLIETLHGIPS
jgi:hypothetical protein